MTAKFTLATLRATLDIEFKPMTVDLANETVTLKNLMRIGDDARKEVMEALKDIEDVQGKDEEGKEQTPEEVAQMSKAITRVLRNVTADGRGDQLIKELDGDLLLSMKVLEGWTVATQAPEAGNSSD